MKQQTTKINTKVLRHLPLASIFILGLISGLPFLLTLSTLSFWLAEVGISNTTIGLFMLVSLPYSFKFLWAPFLDQHRIPILGTLLGKRRSWMLLMQLGLCISLWKLSISNPIVNILETGLAAFFVSFFSASQDILFDAYRIEIVKPRYRGAAAALETIGFRFGMLASGAGALYLADLFNWQTAYQIMALAVGASMIFTLLLTEFKTLENKQASQNPEESINNPHKKSTRFFHRHLLLPLRQFSHRDKLLYILIFIFCFKLADTVLNSMSAPFLCDIGFSKIEFANVSKLFGISLMVIGGLSGGLMMQKMGIYQSAILCAILQSLSCLMFTIQAIVGYDFSVLMITVGVESFSSGLTSAVFIAFLSEFCNQPHTATHFTMLYSMGSLSRSLTSASSGWLADHIGWTSLFLISSMIVLPILYCLNKLEGTEMATFEEKS